MNSLIGFVLEWQNRWKIEEMLLSSNSCLISCDNVQLYANL